MTKIRLAFIHEFADRHGRIRRYFRGRDGKRIPLPGLPGSEEFNRVYEAALAGISLVTPIGEARTLPGTVNAAIVAYYNCGAFRDELKPSTQKMRRAILERFRTQHGDKRIAMLPTVFIVKMLGTLKPFAKRNWLKTLRGLLQFAVATGMRKDDPTQGIKLSRVKSDGIATWTEVEIEAFEARHAIGTRPAARAGAIALYGSASI